jgi:protein-tyrosine kinase
MSRIHDALKRAEQEKAAKAFADEAAKLKPRRPAGNNHREAFASSPGLTEPGTDAPLDSAPAPDVQALLQALEERSAYRDWQPDPTQLLFLNGQDHVMGTEDFRTLRSNLYLQRESQPLQKLMIASALPKDGKTFVAANLARVMSRRRDQRVLLIDGDLRMARQHLMLGAPVAPGLTDYLTGEADEFSVIQKGPLDNLYFIAAGKQVTNPSELIGQGRLKTLLDRLTPAFDWIILDTPPVIPVSDAKLMAELCDGVLVVVRAGSTPSDMAQKACREFRDGHLLGVVLNYADSGKDYGYYYYSGDPEGKRRRRSRRYGKA